MNLSIDLDSWWIWIKQCCLFWLLFFFFGMLSVLDKGMAEVSGTIQNRPCGWGPIHEYPVSID